MLDRSDELLKIEFERLVKKYDEDDPASIDAVNFEASMYWLDFLQAGFDPDQVARLLPSEVKWKNYEILTLYGARISVIDLNFSSKFILAHWGEYIERGVSPDTLAEMCYLCIEDRFDAEMLLENGVSVETIFDLSFERDVLGLICNYPEELREDLALLRKYGELPEKKVTEWLKEHMIDSLLQDIVEDNPEAWREVGVNPEDFAYLWSKKDSPIEG